MAKQKLFSRIFIEKEALAYPLSQKIIASLSGDIIEIDELNQIFGRQTIPFNSKHGELDLFLAVKKGLFVKEAPNAYGYSPNQDCKHYYFLHSFNCIYRCHYCYLQGYFNSPDVVIFVNRNAILDAVKQTILQCQKNQQVGYFYSGEFSDSLALSNVSHEIEDYLTFFAKYENQDFSPILELRTKSINIQSLIKSRAVPQNVIIAYSLASELSIKLFEEKTPSLESRLLSIEKLIKKGYRVAIHLDPIIALSEEQIENGYKELFEKLTSIENFYSKLAYMSVGCLRFSKKSYRNVKKNYFFSPMFSENFQSNDDNMKRYSPAMKEKILGTVERLALKHSIKKSQIYRSME